MTVMRIMITGASVGIGAAAARLFAKEGHELVLAARRKHKLEELREELGNRSEVYELDVACRADVEEAFRHIGPVDVLINNAGLAIGLDPAQEARLDEWERCIAVNINGLLYCTHAVLPGMVQRNQGHIVNLGSIAGNYPYPGGNIYCGTKAFIHQFSLCLKADLLGTNVRVTCLEPGIVEETEFSKIRFRGDEARAKKIYEQAQALTPEDIATAIAFCVNAPAHVNINTMELMPVSQAFAPLSVFRKSSLLLE